MPGMDDRFRWFVVGSILVRLLPMNVLRDDRLRPPSLLLRVLYWLRARMLCYRLYNFHISAIPAIPTTVLPSFVRITGRAGRPLAHLGNAGVVAGRARRWAVLLPVSTAWRFPARSAPVPFPNAYCRRALLIPPVRLPPPFPPACPWCFILFLSPGRLRTAAVLATLRMWFIAGTGTSAMV